jgi:hypothetical protein
MSAEIFGAHVEVWRFGSRVDASSVAATLIFCLMSPYRLKIWHYSLHVFLHGHRDCCKGEKWMSYCPRPT